MNITKNNIDDLNAVITISIEKDDYKDKVEKTLKKFQKTANIKGFRKGHIPMGYIRKQYEKSVLFEEVNEILQTEMNNYIQSEKLSILGNPLPKENENFDWDAEQLNFEFELGLAPEFEIDLSKVKVPYYKVEVDESEIQKYVDNFAKRYGKLTNLEQVEEGANVKVDVSEVDKSGNPIEEGLQKETILFVDELAKPKKIIGKKAEDEIVLKLSDIYSDEIQQEQLLDKDKEGVKEFSSELKLKIKEISKIEPAEINQELFDKIYGEDAVKSEKEFRQRIKDESEKMYVRESDKQFLNEAVEELIKKTKFDLPKDFLSRWLQFTQKLETEEQAKKELEKQEDGLRYQLIESKIVEKYELKVSHEEVEETAKKFIKDQLAMYGQSNVSDEDLDKFVQGSLSNQQEYQRIADQVFADKMINVFKENTKPKEEKVSFDKFLEILTEKSKHNHEHNHDHEH